MWRMGYRDMEVLRSEVDNAGYDIVLSHRGIIRHIQLKASHAGARTAYQTVHLALGAKPSGCVIWLRFERETLALASFLWFGGPPGEPLPDISYMPVARHAKGNAQGVKKERPNLRRIGSALFSQFETMEQVIESLFGADDRRPAGDRR